MILYSDRDDHYSQRVRIVLAEKDITAEINGNDRVKPTPAPVRIAPINIKSKNSLNIPDCFFNKIPEKVKGVFGLLIRANEKAIVGRQ